VRVYRCKICNKIFAIEKGIINHCKDLHPEVDNQLCEKGQPLSIAILLTEGGLIKPLDIPTPWEPKDIPPSDSALNNLQRTESISRFVRHFNLDEIRYLMSDFVT